jgi:hypothetical protein
MVLPRRSEDHQHIAYDLETKPSSPDAVLERYALKKSALSMSNLLLTSRQVHSTAEQATWVEG